MRKQEYNDLPPDITKDRQKAINQTLNKWRKQRTPRALEEYRQRTDNFFKVIEELNIVPSETLYALGIGQNRSTVFRHKNGIGCSPEVAELTRAACATIETMISLAATENRFSPIYAIWLEKSRYGFSDLKGESEQERMSRQVVNEISYELPDDILRKYTLSEPKEDLSKNNISVEELAIPKWLLEDPEEPENFDWQPPIR